MPTMNKINFGTVSEIWGKAWLRQPDGGFRLLKVGDVVERGDVVLTAQNAIVQLSGSDTRPEPVTGVVAGHTPSATRPKDKTAAAAELDRVIDAVNDGEPREAPAAGLSGGEAGTLDLGFRVARIAEELTPAALLLPRVDGEDRQTRLIESDPPELSAGVLALGPMNIQAFEQGPNVAIGLTAPIGTTQVRIDAVPTVGQLLLANGTPVTAGAMLTPAQLGGLVFVPPADYLPGTPVGIVQYTVSNGPSVASGVVNISVIPVNDAPLAVAGAGTGAEDATIPVALLGTDIDGTVTQVRIDQLPSLGTLLLADGGRLHGRVERRGTDHEVPGVVVEILAADVVLALRRDRVRRAADFCDELARVAAWSADERLRARPGCAGGARLRAAVERLRCRRRRRPGSRSPARTASCAPSTTRSAVSAARVTSRSVCCDSGRASILPRSRSGSPSWHGTSRSCAPRSGALRRSRWSGPRTPRLGPSPRALCPREPRLRRARNSPKSLRSPAGARSHGSARFGAGRAG